MTIYFDACALSRLTDESSQLRVHSEAEAVEHILYLVWRGRFQWVASSANQIEVRRNPNEQVRHEILKLLSFAGELIVPNSLARERSRSLHRAGYGVFDALHIACAEQAKADAFLTTDDRLIKRAMRGEGDPAVRIANPVDWLREVDR